MSGKRTGGNRPAPSADCPSRPDRRGIGGADDDYERFLDLAGFAEGRLVSAHHDRVAAFVAGDPEAAGDIAAARSLVLAGSLRPASETVIARALALVDGASGGGVVVSLDERRRVRQVPLLARWASLAAAVAVASWLGFTLGVDTSQSFAQSGVHATSAAQESVLHDLLDPSTGFMRDLTGGTQT